MTPVYLDNNGTTPVDADALKAMLPYLQNEFGNPSSNTALGKRAHDAIETARAQVASLGLQQHVHFAALQCLLHAEPVLDRQQIEVLLSEAAARIIVLELHPVLEFLG